jgi:hypothetical protein
MIQVRQRRIILILICLSAAAAFGLRQLKRSSFFLVQSIDVVWLDTNISIGGQAINVAEVKEWIQVPLGKVGLFDVSVEEAKKNLLSHEWIRDVRIKRKFPNSLQVLVALRMPKALIQFSKDALRYVDRDGFVFGYPDLRSMANLPLLSGLWGHPNEIRQAITLIDHWGTSLVANVSVISSIYFDPERGFRILVSYPLRGEDKRSFRGLDNKFRTMIDLGQEIDIRIDQKLSVLSSVLKYLSDRSMLVRQIWAEVDKKVVVKTVHGS